MRYYSNNFSGHEVQYLPGYNKIQISEILSEQIVLRVDAGCWSRYLDIISLQRFQVSYLSQHWYKLQSINMFLFRFQFLNLTYWTVIKLIVESRVETTF